MGVVFLHEAGNTDTNATGLKLAGDFAIGGGVVSQTLHEEKARNKFPGHPSIQLVDLVLCVPTLYQVAWMCVQVTHQPGDQRKRDSWPW